MFSGKLKKALAVIVAGTVIASSFATLPVYAAVTPETAAITQSYSISNYDSDREFTVKRFGDLQAYSKNQLAMHFGSNNRIPTGIWTTPGQKIKVYVKANSGDAIPQLMFTQHLTDGSGQTIVNLKNGINEIEVPAVSSSVEEGFEVGGSVYIINPYTEEQQSADVRVYIEGGDKFPYFVKNGNVREYIAEMRDYYNHYSKKESGYHNISEIWCDHLIITLSLERMYEAYVKHGLSPQVTAVNMDQFLENMFEFDGLEPSEYKNLSIHLKVTKMAQGVGAFASWRGLVAVPDDGWSGSAIKGVTMGWGYPHEFGHVIDNQPKVQQEVTNNVYSLKYVLENQLYADLVIGKPIADVNNLSSSETTTIYSTNPIGYTDVYMFWDLEVYQEGFNGKLDDMLRNKSCGDTKIDSYLSGCDAKEKVAAYSSKITGIDLTYYFTKYGYIKTTPSANYTNAINAMNLSKSQPKIWYYDSDAYIKSRGSNINLYTKPSLSNYETSSKTMYFTVPTSAAANHLGFEITKDGKFVSYVWDNKYSASDLWGTYTINAYDRALNKYASFTVNTSDSSMTDKYVAKVGSTNYRTLAEAIKSAPDNSTVYLMESATVTSTISIDKKHITLMPADTKKQIIIYNGVGSTSNVFSLTNGSSLTVNTNKSMDNTIVFDGQDRMTYSYFRLSDSVLNLDKGVTVRRCKAKMEGSAVGAFQNSEVNLTGCLIERNQTENRGTFFLSASVLNSSDNTVIRYNRSTLSSSVIQACNDNVINITDTQIYNNHNNHKSDYGTIRLLKSTLVLGNGTVIKNNESDWYNLASAVLTDDVSKVQVSGNVDITDHVSTSVPVEIASDMSGTLTIRPDCDYAKKDAVIVKPVGKYLDSDKLKNITLVNNDFYLDYKNNTFYLSDTAPLVNTSIFSGKNFCVGDSIKIYPSAHGGNGKYTYQYLLETFDENGIEIPLDADSDKEVYEFTFKEKGLYGFTVVVRDSAGKVAYSNQNICTVYDKLVNNSTVSATSVTLGNSVTLKGSATGGAGSYQYAVYYKKKSDKSWTKVQDYKSTVDSKVTPKYATDYIIRVKAKDKFGNIANRDLSVKVNEKLANASKISASSIDIGQSVTVTASAKGGVSPLTYAVLYKKTSDSKWTTKQGFKANATVSIKPESATTYDICVKVKDSQGTIEKKFFTLTVNKGLENKSTISASTIKQGSSVTVKCSASGGSGYYNYAVFYKKESDSKWTTKQNFSSNSNVSVTPQKATTYDICVKVRDNADRETKKYFKLTVTNAELSNNSKISAETVKVNGTVKITGVATGGTSPYTYAFYYKDMNGSAWTEKQNFSSNSAVSVKFTKSGVYNICAKIKDNKGTVAKKYFTVTVEK